MALVPCICGGDGGDTAYINCFGSQHLHAKDVFIDTYNLTERNSIKATDFVAGVLPIAFFVGDTGLFDNTDVTKKGFITPDSYEEQNPETTESTKKTSTAGTMKVLQAGLQSSAGQLWDVPLAWASKINEKSCGDKASYQILEDGAIRGELSKDGTEFFPIRIEPNSLEAVPREMKAGDTSWVDVTYQWSRKVNPGRVAIIAAANVTPELINAIGMLKGTLSAGVTTNTDTDIYVKFNGDYGTFPALAPVVGKDDDSKWTCTIAVSPFTPIAISAVEEILDAQDVLVEYKVTIAVSDDIAVRVSFSDPRTKVDAFVYNVNTFGLQTGPT